MLKDKGLCNKIRGGARLALQLLYAFNVTYFHLSAFSTLLLAIYMTTFRQFPLHPAFHQEPDTNVLSWQRALGK